MSEDQKPADPAAKRAPVATPVEERKSPKDWALATGNGPSTARQKNTWTGPGFSGPKGSVEHEVAAVLHGWREHEHETGAPMQLTEAEYRAALAATHPADEHEVEKDGKTPKRDQYGNPVLKRGFSGIPVPHPAALSPYKGQLGKVRLGEKPKAVAS